MTNLFQRAFHLAHLIFPSGGTCLEFGVYVGRTYIWQARQILERYPQSKLIGFDSWEGLPEETPGVWMPDRHSAARFASPKEVVTQKLDALIAERERERERERFRLVDGFFSDSLTDAVRSTISDVIFVNIDVDIHRSTIELLDFVKPLLRPGVVLYWDDWKDPRDDYHGKWGEHLAWEQWSSRHPDIVVETIEVNPLNQRIMIVMSANGVTAADTGFSILKARQAAYRLASVPQDPDYVRFLRLKDRLRKLPFSRLLRCFLRALAK